MLKAYNRILLGVIVCLWVSITHAEVANLDDKFIAFVRSFSVMSLSAGPTWGNAGQSQTLNLSQNIIKTYTANKPTNAMSSGEFFLGVRNSLSKRLEGQLGLAFVAAGNAGLSGYIWDDADAIFDNYTYQYKINHTSVLLKGKLLGNWNLPVIPWVSASVGIGFNHAYGYSNTPTISEAVQMPNFATHTTTAFTYAIGVGVQRCLNSHWQAGVGYEFSDWGKSQLGVIGGESGNQGLSLSHLYTNSILFNLTYLA